MLEASADGGALKTARKGTSNYEITVYGKAAHAGLEPEKGANAGIELAHQILALDARSASGTDHGHADRAVGRHHGQHRARAGDGGGGRPGDQPRGAVAGGRADAGAHPPDPGDPAEGERRAEPSSPGGVLRGGPVRAGLPDREGSGHGTAAGDRRGRRLRRQLHRGGRLPDARRAGRAGRRRARAHEHVVVAEMPIRTKLLTELVASVLAGKGRG